MRISDWSSDVCSSDLAGGDRIDGAGGFDTAVYSGSAAGVKINLATGAVSGGDAQGDSLSAIEAVVGSGFADTLTGDADANRLEGGGGNDAIDGGAGADAMIGRSEEHTSELQSLMRSPYAVFCLQ